LAATNFNGGDETMRASYLQVERDLKDPDKAYVYYSAMPETREITGTSINSVRATE
jgi:hypothetical protein